MFHPRSHFRDWELSFVGNQLGCNALVFTYRTRFLETTYAAPLYDYTTTSHVMSQDFSSDLFDAMIR
uniref:Peptidase n=1 Tax=Heterorhabditis bacteriophora TaxID=37862 RepID=A0A1I7WDY1_HETBA